MSNLPSPPADGICFYILTEDCAYGSKYFQAGNLCFCSERSYLRNFAEDGPPACFLKVIMLDDSSTVTINLEILQPVRQEAAGFLLAVGSHSERLNFFLERLRLEGALRATPGQNVMVEVEREFFPGVVRYVGSIYKPSLAVLTPVFFGVELQVGGGRSDGSYHGTEYFKCKRNCGIFLPFSKVQFIPTPENDYGKQKPRKEDTEEVVPVKVGDAVSFYVDEILTKGIAMAVYREGNQWFVKVCPVRGLERSWEGAGAPRMAEGGGRAHPGEKEAQGGTFWLPKFPDRNSAQTFGASRKGRSGPGEKVKEIPFLAGGQEVFPQTPESFPPLRNEAAVRVLRGQMKGIQGHCNSCYMDATLFRDDEATIPAYLLFPWHKFGIFGWKKCLVSHQTTLSALSPGALPGQIPLGNSQFLCYHIPHPVTSPGRSGGQKEHDCYCYQIFMDQQEDLVVPDVQQLVERSFLSSDLKLVEIPSCFIIQMPRFGKEYKMFSKIIPSLELDITDLLLDSPRECCLCGDVATLECSECFKDKVFAATGLKQFCSSCSRQVHSHRRRQAHKPRRLHIPEEFRSCSARGCQQVPREKLELFAVLCIETSHYVSFVKYGPGSEHWMFFDSMADRHGGENGFNIPTVTLCPEIAKYLDLPLAVLALEQPRDMDGVAKRLFCDAYMYLYQSRKMALYK
uniref:ubiquitinyl hydrolase 1 n=1 Tax=Malurus cyaneus samueli TaxID=2593467 RepID=A0A8C5TBX2_9PASS